MIDLTAWKRYKRCFLSDRESRIQKMFAASMVVLLILVMAGCGKKAPPKPPEGEMLPPTVSDLTANVTGDTLELSWTVPPTTEKHPALAAGFRVLAFKENRGDPCPDCPPNFKPIGNLKILGELNKAAGQQTTRFKYPLDTGYRYTITVISVAENGSLGAESNTLKIDH